jgi:superfamily II DNA or RNA helicase
MDFGLVVFDEAHHAPSEYFSRALPIISCKLTLGLSATPKRADKMEKILYWYLGDIAYSAPPNKNDNVIVRAYNYDVKDKNFKEARLPFKGEVNRPKTLNRIVAIEQRNIFIIDLLKEIMLEPGRQVLILSDRIEHLELLKNMIDSIHMDGNQLYSCEYYIGGLKQKKLDEASNAMIILGTYGMASEGLDIPTLNTLIMATPRREVEQSIGRIIRKTDHVVQPLIIDIVDMLSCFVNQGIYRRKLYKKLNYKIEVYEVENSVIVSKLELNNTIDIKEIKNIKLDNNSTVDFID